MRPNKRLKLTARGGDWLDLCVTRADSTAVKFHIEAWRTGEWGSKGDDLRTDMRATLAARFGARFGEDP